MDRNGWVFDGPQRYTTTLPTDRLRCRHHRYGFYRDAEKVHRGRGGGGGITDYAVRVQCKNNDDNGLIFFSFYVLYF